MRVLYQLKKRLFNCILMVFYSDEYSCCELCHRPTHQSQFSDYYSDVDACTRCCPLGYCDQDVKAMCDLSHQKDGE